MNLFTFLLPLLALAAGWLSWTRLPPGHDDREDLIESAFAVVLAAVIAAGLLALLLASFGVLKPELLAGALLAVSGVLAFIRRRSGLGVRPPRGHIAAVLIVAGVAAASVAPASEDLLGGRDPGVYATTATWLAQRGTLRVHSPALADVGSDGRFLFHRGVVVPGFYVRRASTGEIAPQFFHLHPTYMAIGYWVGGLPGVFLVPPAFGVLAVLSVFLFVRRLAGVWPALIAATLLTLNLAQVWNARSPYSEAATQLGLFAALWCIAAAHRTGGLRWGALGAAALGTTQLVRIDAPLLLAAVAPALVVLAAGERERRWLTRTFLPLASVFALWGGLHGWLYSRPYVNALARSVRPLWALTAAVLILSAVALARPARLQRLVDWVHRHARVLWVVLSLALCAAFVFGLWIRPSMEPFDVRPRSGDRTFIEESLVRVGWYVSVPGLVLALGGLILLLRRWLMDRRAEWLPVTAVLLAFSILYFRNPHIYPDHPWMMRRFLPVVVPGICIAIAFAAEWLWSVRRRWRWAFRALAAAGVGYVLLHEVLLLRPFWNFREKKGAIEQVAAVARQVPAGAVVLFDYPGYGTRVATPLAFAWLHESLPLIRDRRRDPTGELRVERFESQVMRWMAAGRPVQYLTSSDGDWPILAPSLRWDEVARFRIQVPTFGVWIRQPPQHPQIMLEHFRLLRASPALERLLPCAGSTLPMDRRLPASTQGLYPVEGRRRPYRWAMPKARVLFPSCDRTSGGRPGALEVRAACGRGGSNPPCPVTVSVNGRPAGLLHLQRRFSVQRVPIPAEAVTDAIGPIDVRLEGPVVSPAPPPREDRVVSFQISRLSVLAQP